MTKPRSKAPLPGVFLLSIGDELLDGRTQNTNASFFGEQLRHAGVAVAEVRCVSDRIEDIVKALKAASSFSVVVATGGLGPTNDDRTMQAASKAFRCKLKATKQSLDHVRSRYLARNLPLTEPRLRLAEVPDGSKVLQNPTGTAPGVELKVGSTIFYFLPGPPNECRPMFLQEILPVAIRRSGAKRLVKREFWRTFGRGESEVYGRIAPLVEEMERKYPQTFAFGVHISFPCIDLTLEIWDVRGQKKPSSKEVQELSQSINEALGPLCFSRERELLVEAVARQLKAKGLTLSVAESCTGGLVGKLLTDLPGSSEFFWGGVVSYDNKAKTRLLGVKESTLAKDGAVSEATVREMAEQMRQKLGTDFSLALSGVAGPGGGSEAKPVGTIHVALSSSSGTKTMHQVIFHGKGSRDQNRLVAAHLAFDLLRNALQE